MKNEKDPTVGNIFYTGEEAKEMQMLLSLHHSLIKLYSYYTEQGINDPNIDLVQHLNENKHSPFLNMVIERMGQIKTDGIERFKKFNS